MTEYYKKFTDLKIRLKAIAFLLMSFALLGIVIIDSFRLGLPFHYILFFILGISISVVINHFSRFSWDDIHSRVTSDMNYVFLLILVGWFLCEYFLLPAVLNKIEIIHIRAALLLTSSGLYYGRIIFMWKSIRALLFTDEKIYRYFESRYKKNRPPT